MNSTRLPGKMMMSLGQYPLIDWILRRCKKSQLVDKWILATSEKESNSILCNQADKYEIEYYRGSEEDVLSRFVLLSEKYKPDNLVRVCADNPFIESSEIDRLIEFFGNNECDYAFNHIPKNGNNYTDGLGAEIFSRQTLESMSREVYSPRHKEHATQFIWDHPERFSIGTVQAPIHFAHPEIRLDVDKLEDLKFLENLIEDKDSLPEKVSAQSIIDKIRKTK